MAQLYADENIDHDLADALNSLGHDVLTAQAAGQAQQGIPDDRQLEFAFVRGRIVLTLDRRDFFALHRNNPNHCGIIVCTVDHDVPALAARIDAAIQANESLVGRLIRVNKPG